MRMKVWLACIAMGAALAAASSRAASAPEAGGPDLIPAEGIRVAAVDVRGNRLVSRETILAAVSARPGETITRDQLNRDVEAITRLGFFRDVRPPEVALTPEGASITYVLEEYPRVRSIEFTGNTLFTAAELTKILNFPLGGAFNRDALTRNLSAIEDAYRAKGYAARIGENVSIGPEGIVTIPIHEVRVVTVDIEGLRHVRQSIVRKALTLKPGELFNERTLQQDFARLQQLGVFDQIDPQITFNVDGDAIITWLLREGKTRAVNFGLSYNPQDSLVGNVGFTENNFRGRAEQLRTTLSIGTLQGGQMGGEIAYATPVLGSGVAYNARVYSTIDYRFSQRVLVPIGQPIGRYFERHAGAQAGAAYDLGRGRQLAFTARAEAVKIYNLPSGFVAPGIPSLDSAVYAVSGQVSRDRRDYIFNPTGGDFAQAVADVGFVTRGSASGSSGVMVKPQAEWRTYLPLRPHRALLPTQRQQEHIPVVATRLALGTSLGNLPFFEQYFVGGANTLRGYLEDRFWGRHSVLANVELRYPVFGSVIAALFADAGDAWASDFRFEGISGVSTVFRQSSAFQPRLGGGAGIRYLSPLGPLRLDLAYGDALRVHFTIGQTF